MGIETLTIAESEQESGVVQAATGSLLSNGTHALAIQTPAEFTGTITIGISMLAEGPFVPLRSNGVIIELAAGFGDVLRPFPFPFFKFISSQAEAADRNIMINAIKG